MEHQILNDSLNNFLNDNSLNDSLNDLTKAPVARRGLEQGEATPSYLIT